MQWRLRSGGNLKLDAGVHLRLMYRSAIERFFVVIGLLAIGLVKIDLQPFAILLGFVAGQVGMILAYLIIGMRKEVE